MPLVASIFADGLKAIKTPKSEAEAAQKWTDAWEKYISMALQIASPAASVQAFHGVMMSAFAPIPAMPTFFLKLTDAMTAGLNAAILIPNYGVTLIPNAAPLGYVPALADNESQPRTELADKVHSWTTLWMCTGIPPDFSGAGPLS
jgi:hypothetical protein